MAISINRNRLLGLRLANHLITDDDGDTTAGVDDVVLRLLALQAQDFGQALWALALRSPGANRADVLAALERGVVVRSWPMRGTLHFVLAKDLRWMLRLTTGRMLASVATRQGQLGLDQRTLERARATAEVALTGARLSRQEFLTVLEAAGIDTANQRGYHLIWYLAQTGLLCWGPPLGAQQALVLLDEWIPQTPLPPREQALRDFVLRYFIGHGPATLRDFVWWSKLTVADAKVGLGLAREELAEVACEGITYWVGASDLDREAGAAAGGAAGGAVHLLPAFDEYVIGYQDRAPVLPAEYAQRIVPGNNGVFQPTIIVNGRVAGTWRAPTARADAALRQDFFEPFTDAGRDGVAAKVARYARFAAST